MTIYSETPIYDTLKDYLSKDPVRMHVPFHNGIPNNNIFPKELYNLDISEVSGYDIEGEDNPIFQSEKITADCFDVEHSFYLTGGASIGLAAGLIALNKHGKKVILARNVHKSVINGVILSGLEPIWLDVDFLSEWKIFSKINLAKLEELISASNDIAGCVIVSPTYEGVISDIKEVSNICHKKNIPLIVDEAHGGHLYFLELNEHDSMSFPGLTRESSFKNDNGNCLDSRFRGNDKMLQTSALRLGADLVIQSWHKSLGSFTQSGVLHLVNEQFFTYKDIKRSLDLISSTSPSFLLLLSLELTRKHLAVQAGFKPASTNIFNSLLTIAESLKKEMREIKNLEIFNSDDPFKIYLKSKNISGLDFAFELYKKYAIEIESANDTGLLMLIGQGFNNEIKNRIIKAIKEIIIRSRDVARNVSTAKSKPQINKFKSDPRRAFIQGFQNKTNCKYHSEITAPCPPGYAINVPGMNYESCD